MATARPGQGIGIGIRIEVEVADEELGQAGDWQRGEVIFLPPPQPPPGERAKTCAVGGTAASVAYRRKEKGVGPEESSRRHSQQYTLPAALSLSLSLSCTQRHAKKNSC